MVTLSSTRRLYSISSRSWSRSKSPGVKASFWRGGTSNGIMINGADLPMWNRLNATGKLNTKHVASILEPFFRAAMGSPDPYGRQLNGMGGGISSLSKAVIVEKSQTPNVDIDYMFVQIGIKDGKLDLAGNCGNMSSAVAPFAMDDGLLDEQTLDDIANEARKLNMRREISGDTVKNVPLTLRLRNMNTNKNLMALISASKSPDGWWMFQEQGSYELDGVSGYASPISLSFLDPAGSKTGQAMPTGNAVDDLSINGQLIQASLLDISNPGVFIDGRSIGWNTSSKPEELTANSSLMTYLEAIRREGAVRMGMNPDTPSIPKIVLVFPPASEDVDITCQALSMEQAHKAVPVTLALNLGVACKMQGTIPFQLARQKHPENTTIGHPSGKMEVGAEMSDGVVKGAKLVRTARCLMRGYVNDTSSDEWLETSSARN